MDTTIAAETGMMVLVKTAGKPIASMCFQDATMTLKGTYRLANIFRCTPRYHKA